MFFNRKPHPDTVALDTIASILSGPGDWSADHLDAIAAVLNASRPKSEDADGATAWEHGTPAPWVDRHYVIG